MFGLATEGLTGEGSGGAGGFSYGGEWDAEATVTPSDVTTFDELYNCTFASDVLTVTSGNLSAFVRNISSIDSGTTRKFRFNWPDTTPSAFMVGFIESSATDMATIAADPNAVVFAIGAFMGATTIFSKSLAGDLVQDAYTGTPIEVGDVIILAYRAATQTIYLYNETQGSILVHQFSSLSEHFTERPSLFVGGSALATLSCTFEDGGGYPLQKDMIALEYPEDLTKTYYVSNVTQESAINGKALFVGDFINFITDEGVVVDAAVSRLVEDADIREVVVETLAEQNITTSALENPSNFDSIPLQNATDFYISLTVAGGYDPSPAFVFALDDNSFDAGRTVRISLTTEIEVSSFTINHNNTLGQAVLLETLLAGDAWVFVFEKRGVYAELISKYQV